MTARPLGLGSVTVTVTTPTGLPNRRIITSTGSVADLGMTITRTVRASMDIGDVPPVFYNALAAKTSFGINGNVSVDSTPAAHRGNVHCNQNVTLSGSAMNIDGAVTASGTVTASGSPTVTGGMSSGVPPMTFPEVDGSFKDRALANGITNPSGGTLSVDDSATLVQGKINGNLDVGDDGCRVNGVVWVTGTVTVSGPITGTGTIVSDGPMSLDGRFTVNAASDVSNVVYITTSTSDAAVDLGGTGTSRA